MQTYQVRNKREASYDNKQFANIKLIQLWFSEETRIVSVRLAKKQIAVPPI